MISALALCGACVLPEVGVRDSAQNSASVDTGGPAVSSTPASASSHSEASPAGTMVDAGSSVGTPAVAAAAPKKADAGSAGATNGDPCLVDNGGCDSSPRAKCIQRTGGAIGCMCPSGSAGDGVGDDGCKPTIPPAAVVPLACGKYTCDAETVKDPATGLTWQRLLPETYGCSGSAHVMGDLCRWNEAKSYCSKLVLGSGAWRLPTKDELLSIVDKRTSPSTDAVAFPDTPALWFWSATPYEENEYSAWSVHFYDGTPSYDDMRQQFLVRCVR